MKVLVLEMVHKPYRQSERKETGIYKKYADKLIESGHAYYAFDTSEELDEMRKRLEAQKLWRPNTMLLHVKTCAIV